MIRRVLFSAVSVRMRPLSLAERGLEWIHPPAPLAHPLDDGTAVMLERSVADTAQALGADARAYRRRLRKKEERKKEHGRQTRTTAAHHGQPGTAPRKSAALSYFFGTESRLTDKAPGAPNKSDATALRSALSG